MASFCGLSSPAGEVRSLAVLTKIKTSFEMVFCLHFPPAFTILCHSQAADGSECEQLVSTGNPVTYICINEKQRCVVVAVENTIRWVSGW